MPSIDNLYALSRLFRLSMRLAGPYREVYCYISEYIVENGISPTYKEIQAYMGYRSTSSAYYIVRQLEIYGYLYKTAGTKRMLRVHAADKKQ